MIWSNKWLICKIYWTKRMSWSLSFRMKSLKTNLNRTDNSKKHVMKPVQCDKRSRKSKIKWPKPPSLFLLNASASRIWRGSKDFCRAYSTELVMSSVSNKTVRLFMAMASSKWECRWDKGRVVILETPANFQSSEWSTTYPDSFSNCKSKLCLICFNDFLHGEPCTRINSL